MTVIGADISSTATNMQDAIKSKITKSEKNNTDHMIKKKIIVDNESYSNKSLEPGLHF